MKVVASQGAGSNVYLVDLDDGMACIVNLRAEKAWPQRSMESASKGGYWVPVALAPVTEREILALVDRSGHHPG